MPKMPTPTPGIYRAGRSDSMRFTRVQPALFGDWLKKIPVVGGLAGTAAGWACGQCNRLSGWARTACETACRLR